MRTPSVKQPKDYGINTPPRSAFLFRFLLAFPAANLAIAFFFPFFFYKNLWGGLKGKKIIDHYKLKIIEIQIAFRLTIEATVNSTKSGKQVVNFNVAVNEKFRIKATGELKSSVRSVRYSYLLNTQRRAVFNQRKTGQIEGRY